MIYIRSANFINRSFNTPFLPRYIKRLRFNPTPRTTNNIAKIDAFVTRYELPTEEHPPSITGDVDMFDNSNHNELQVEGLTCVALPRPEAYEDRRLFFQTVWEEDVSSGLSARDAIKPDTEEEVELIELCERFAYYHFRNLQAQAATTEVQATHKPLLNYLCEFLPEIEVGNHPTFKKEWLHTTLDQLSFLADRYCNSIDFAIMNAVGANLPSVLRGKTTMLEHMLEGNMLPRFYREGIGFRKINIALAQTVKQIAHRYPRMSILEIGAGTGGTTKEVLRILEGAFATYNYTDVSAGFFPAAREEFKSWETQMQFQVLDIEDDACSANFGNPNFDLIIASNVLHATKNLRETTKNVRSLLKPGGFILLTELTGDTLRPSLIFGGLPGWWSGVDDGRRFKPGISTKEWDALLRETGFSGIQSCIHDFQDPARQTFSLIVSQATDSFIDLMRQTTLHTENYGSNNGLLIIGGNTKRGLLVRRKVELFLSVWKGPMSILDSLEQIDATLMETVTTILNITELDAPLFEKLSPNTFAGLQMLFHHARNIFWVTENCSEDNPYSNITVGLGRTVASESPHLRLQFLDIDCVNELTPARITESFVRFLHAEFAGISSVPRLWTTEPELKYVQDRLLIPRILPVRGMNDRLNAHYRPIIQSLPVSEPKPQHTYWRNESYEKGFIRVRVSRSSLHALKVAPNIYLYLCLGHLAEERSKTLLAFSSSRDSIVRIPQSWAIRIELTAEVEERAIAVMNSLQIVREISIAKEPGNLLLRTDDILFSRIIYKKLSEMHWKVTLITTKRPNDCDNRPTIFIHKNAPTRDIVAILPSDLSVTLDLTKRTAGEPSIFDAIPFFQDQYSGPDFFCAEPIHPPKYFRATITNVLQDLFSRFLGIPMDWTSSLGLPSISNTTLRSSTDLNLSFLTSVNWDINSLPLPQRIIPIDPVSLFCGDRTYLMIGLTGDIGQSLCLWMVRHGVRHIIVSSRNPSIGDPWQQEIERIGAKILVKAMDVTDRSALTKLEKHIRDEWPPLAGIANAAMVLADMPFNDMSYENFNRVLQPKVNGTAYLEQIFKYHELDFFVMFSSLASVIGNAGQSNYAAANMVRRLVVYVMMRLLM
jgi:SAM-dependent methyltransferase